MRMPPDTPVAAGPVPLAGYYLLYFASVGVLLPFLPAYLTARGLSASEIGLLLSLTPLFSLVGPSLWGPLADRTGRADRLLTVVSFGAALGFSPMLRVTRFEEAAWALAAYAFFVSSVTTLVDSLALHRVSLFGGSYARLRLFGSIGFVLASSSFGFFVSELDARTVQVPLALMFGYALWSLGIRVQSLPDLAPRPRFAGLRLLRDRALACVLVASALHWIASAPFHGIFAIHVTALGLPPWVVGVTAAVGVVAEIAVMAAHAPLSRALTPRHLLALAFAGSALRWWGMALAETPAALLALALLHGLSFGAFYVAGVAFVADRVPAQSRATGQGLFVSITFGLGGLVGFTSAGLGYDWLGGSRLFAVAGFVELLPLGLVWAVRSGPHGISGASSASGPT